MSNVISTAVSKTLNVVLAQGSAVFNNADNSITLVGIGKDIEVGDVIQVIGAPSNSREFTLEEIVSTGKIIVNKAHAGGTTTKSLVSETATVTVKLLCKWYLAPIGLGQGWVDVTANRSIASPYETFNRSIEVIISTSATADNSKIFNLTSNAVPISVAGKIDDPFSVAEAGGVIEHGSEYVINMLSGANLAGYVWRELR